MLNRFPFAKVIDGLKRRTRLAAVALAMLAVLAVTFQPAAALMQNASAPQGSHHSGVAAMADHDCDGPAAAGPTEPTGHGPFHLGACLSICCLAMLPVAAPIVLAHHPVSIRRTPPVAKRLTGETPSLDPPPPRAA